MLRKARAVLVDLSGTLHIDDTAIPGAVNALKRLRSSGLKVRFVTNTSKESSRALHSRLLDLGFEVTAEEMFSSLAATRLLAFERGLRPLFLVDPAAEEEFEGLDSNQPNAVLIGLAPGQFNYPKLNQAFRLVLDGAQLIAINKGRYYQTKDGLSLGAGSFVAALEYATGKQAEVVGKPTKAFFQASLRGLDVQPDEVIMIGDDVKDDILGAVEAGIQGVLVKTGKFRPGDEDKLPEGAFLAENFPDAVDMILRAKKNL
ncbi:haloacid dehalogenase-like hydrolase domain-containing protein 2 [Neocloeon triangulifer]|uniref:haloacid dehalogenase-like hydrolase domain-containing protein 2 n=1 Tax=Neocloeon triangulifer TaxID=2078957 RepID=UPI00286F2948|nr:haloacid dehalogenase-like hydrolase domain-containing protein 2 [Neocloeon triangulifer]